MVGSRNYDVVVLGAGIAGLLMASELSKEFSVAVVEREERIPECKYWLSNQRSLDLNPELRPCIDTPYDYIDVVAHDRTRCRCYGNYYLWNTAKLIDHFAGSILANGGEIITGTSFESHRCSADKVEIQTDSMALCARLILDCMGFGSPIIRENRLLDPVGYYVLYGTTLELRTDIPPIGFCNPFQQERAQYFEAFPTGDGRAHAVVISPERTAYPYRQLEGTFTDMVADSWLKDWFHSPKKGSTILGGVIPVGKLRRKALDRVLFFGESCQLNPASTATGFTRMLYTYKDLSRALSSRISEDRLKRRDLEKVGISFLSPFNRRFQMNVFEESLDWDSTDFLGLVKQMQKLDSSLVYDIFFGDLNYSSVLRPSTLARLVGARNTIFLRNGLKAISPMG